MDSSNIQIHQQGQQIFLPCVYNEENNRYEPVIQPLHYQITKQQVQVQENPNVVLPKQFIRQGSLYQQPTVNTKNPRNFSMSTDILDSPYSDFTPSPQQSPDLYGNKKKRSTRTQTSST